jgi:dTDP-glucose 4,6-dehydratase
VFIESNVTWTYNQLQAVREHYDNLNGECKERFHLHHISTDEVFGTSGTEGLFSETTP